MAKVTLEKVSKFYGDVEAVKKINLEIKDKEFLVLVGPSGCGKSSSLRMIAGLEEIDEGIIKIGDKTVNELEPRERNVSMVFQNYALYPHMTVEENLGFSLKIAGQEKKEIEERVKEAAEILDITETNDDNSAIKLVLQNNFSNLINDYTPNNIGEFKKIGEQIGVAKLNTRPYAKASEKYNNIAKLILLKDYIAEGIWFILMGLFVINVSNGYVSESACV